MHIAGEEGTAPEAAAAAGETVGLFGIQAAQEQEGAAPARKTLAKNWFQARQAACEPTVEVGKQVGACLHLDSYPPPPWRGSLPLEAKERGSTLLQRLQPLLRLQTTIRSLFSSIGCKMM